MRARNALSALGLAVVATLVVATPAHAAPFTDGDVVVDGTTWQVSSFETGSNPYIGDVYNDGWEGNTSTYDSGLSPVYLSTGVVDLADFDDLDCAADGDRATATDGTGDVIVTCPLGAFESGNGTLDAVWEQRFFSDGVTVRSRLIVTNNTAATVAGATVGITENYYQDDDTRLGASSTAGDGAPESTTTVDGDLIWVTYDILTSDGYEAPVVLTAAGTADAAVPPTMGESVGDGEDNQTTMYPLIDLAPSQSLEIVQFTVWNLFTFDVLVPNAAPLDDATDAPTERPTTEVVTDEGLTKTAFLEPSLEFVPAALVAVTELWDDRDRFDSLGARDAAGIADPSLVLNWGPYEPELAATGPSDLLPLTALAGLLLLAGATVVVARRRTA